MKKNIDLLEGHIFTSLTGLALPIMATSLVQMAYNLTDMAWIGQVGSKAVAAVGAAGMYTWPVSYTHLVWELSKCLEREFIIRW